MINNSFENKDQQSQKPAEPRQPPDPVEKKDRWTSIWMKMVWMGFGEKFLQIGSAMITLILICIVLWFMGKYYLRNRSEQQVQTSETVRETITVADAVLPYYNPSYPRLENKEIHEGIFRFSQNHTDLPAKPRSEVIKS